MSKIVTIPSNSTFIPANISANEMIGDISNYDPVNRTFEVSNITVSNVKNVIAESTTSISDLCGSSKVNKSALFRPSGTAPYRLGDFAGYNHTALPQTYFVNKYVGATTATIDYLTNKVEVQIQVARGERPPELDNSSKSWDRIRLNVSTTGATTQSISADGAASSSYIPVKFQLTVPSNDPCLLNCNISGSYFNSSGSVVGLIEDTYPSFTLNCLPIYTKIDILSQASWQTYTSFYHYFQSAGSWQRAYFGTTTSIKVDNSTNPSKGYMYGSFYNPISSTYYHQFFIAKVSGNYYRISVNFFEDGDRYKKNGKWYEVNTDLNNTFTVSSVQSVGGYFTINSDGTLNTTNFDY